MSKSLIWIETPQTSEQILTTQSVGATDSKGFLTNLINLLEGIIGGAQDAWINVQWVPVQASIVGTLTAAPTAAQAMTIAGQTITARASGAGANEFNIGADNVETMENAAAAINASAVLSPWVFAEASAGATTDGVITIRAVQPGVVGNAITLAENLSNFAFAGAATRLAGGSVGTSGSASYVLGSVQQSS